MSEVQRGNTVIEAKDLRPGEEILWQSATEPIGLLEGSCGKQIIKSWIITTVITLALVIACAAVIGSIQFKLLAVVAVVWLCIMMAPVQDWRTAKAQQYAVTNQRAIVVQKDKTMYTMELGKVDDVQIYRPSDKENCLLLGSKTEAEAKNKLRWLAGHPLGTTFSEKDNAAGMVFYCVKNVERALSIVSGSWCGILPAYSGPALSCGRSASGTRRRWWAVLASAGGPSAALSF